MTKEEEKALRFQADQRALAVVGRAKKATALRYNTDKPVLSMLDPGALEETARVLMFGADKYARNNWKKGLKWTQILDSMWRHMNRILEGEDRDQETDLLHAAHILCNAMFLCHHMINEVGEDDR